MDIKNFCIAPSFFRKNKKEKRRKIWDFFQFSFADTFLLDFYRVWCLKTLNSIWFVFGNDPEMVTHVDDVTFIVVSSCKRTLKVFFIHCSIFAIFLFRFLCVRTLFRFLLSMCSSICIAWMKTLAHRRQQCYIFRCFFSSLYLVCRFTFKILNSFFSSSIFFSQFFLVVHVEWVKKFLSFRLIKNVYSISWRSSLL